MDSQTIGLEGTIAVICADPLHRAPEPCPGAAGAVPPPAHLLCRRELGARRGQLTALCCLAPRLQREPLQPPPPAYRFFALHLCIGTLSQLTRCFSAAKSLWTLQRQARGSRGLAGPCRALCSGCAIGADGVTAAACAACAAAPRPAPPAPPAAAAAVTLGRCPGTRCFTNHRLLFITDCDCGLWGVRRQRFKKVKINLNSEAVLVCPSPIPLRGDSPSGVPSPSGAAVRWQ